jgi:putative methyltransferase (TIGR04325 family)
MPPAAWEAARQVRASLRPREHGWAVAEGGKRAFDKSGTEWDTAAVAAAYERRWPLFERVRGSAVPPVFASEEETLTFDPETDLPSASTIFRHNSILGLVYGITRASKQRGCLKMLDWGGGVGHQYGLVRSLLPDLRLDYTCFDLPVSVRLGSKRFPDARFTSDFTCLNEEYDLIVANGSLHYFKEWQDVVRQFLASSKGFIFITMLPVLLDADSCVMIQQWSNVDGTRYAEPEWFISRDELMQLGGSKPWRLERELVCGYSPQVPGSPAKADYRGFLFERVNAP